MTEVASQQPYEIINNLSAFKILEFEPVGKWFEMYNYIKHQGDMNLEDFDESSSSEEEQEEEETPEFLNYLHSLDPKEWKKQDHYKVLGIENLRYKATMHQIKKAHKSKVLKHHPDKVKQSGSKKGEYFTCITKAFETLSDPIKRKAFDSVDPEFNESIPSISENSKKNFYKVFGKAFENNSRWSIKKDVPKLGDENATFDEVNDFYSFWYDFDSWREFSYLDEENKETAQDRDERRWIEKQNKAARLKLKKEETTRIRQLVDNAYACDPRIIKFKQEEKRRKEEEKLKKREAIRLREEEEAKKIEAARLEKERKDEEERLKIEAEKSEREKQKKAIKKERKNLRTVAKEFDYFSIDPKDLVYKIERIEKLVDLLNLNEIQKLNESIQKCNGNKEQIGKLIFNTLNQYERKEIEEEKQTIAHRVKNLSISESKSEGDTSAATVAAVASSIPPVISEKPAAASVAAAATSSSNSEWCDDEIKLLVKACKVIATGTRDRWEVIANFIEEHSRGKYKRTGKEVLTKTKDMQKHSTEIKEEANKKAFEKTLQTIKTPAPTESTIVEKPSERYATPGEQLLAEQGTNPSPWSTDEQKILEQALKTYPATLADRWDQIASCLPTRSKKDCIARYKELVELIQSKKKAQQKAQANK